MKPTKKVGKIVKPSKYTICDKTFSNKPQSKRHYASVHEGQKQYTCVLCQDGFNTVKNLKEHMEMVHDGAKPQNHISRLHDEKIENISQLAGMKQKIKIGHSLKHHPCPHCEKHFTRTDNLATHIKTFHEGRRYEECPICHITFSQPYMRKKHIESVHEGKKLLLCPKEGCDKAFSRQKGLNKHINHVHEGKKPHSCDFCGFAFRDKFGLARHIASEKCIKIRHAPNKEATSLPSF